MNDGIVKIQELKDYIPVPPDHVEALAHELVFECAAGFNKITGRPVSDDFPNGINTFLLNRIDVVSSDGARILSGKFTLFVAGRRWYSLPICVFPQGRYYEDVAENPGRLLKPAVLIQQGTQYGIELDGLDCDDANIVVVLSGILYRQS